jgi:hypothetical protein
VFARLRRHLTYANVTATLALFIAVGGSGAYAVSKITGGEIANRTITERNIRLHTLTARSINHARLGKVLRARDADRVGGFTGGQLKIRCPSDTLPFADVCVERTARAPAPYGSAHVVCAEVGTPRGPGRRLPTHAELTEALSGQQLGIQLVDGGELTSDVYPSSSDPGRLDVLYVTDRTGRVGVTPDTDAGKKAYRCVTGPLN